MLDRPLPGITIEVPKKELMGYSRFCVTCGCFLGYLTPPVCDDCLQDLAEKEADHRAEQEQARRPF